MISINLAILITGYIESSLMLSQRATLLYYYKGVGNSNIYLISAHITTIVVVFFYLKFSALTQAQKELEYELSALGEKE